MQSCTSTVDTKSDRTWLRRGGGLVGALLGGALLLAACGSNKTAATTTTLTGGATTTTSQPSGGSTSPTTTVAAGVGGDLGALASKLQAGETVTYDASYSVTTSGKNETIEFAAEPPSSFALKVNNSSGLTEIISTGTKAYSCTQATGSSSWTCISFPPSDAATYTALAQIYEGKYWYQNILAIKAAAAANGVTVSTSTKSVAGVTLQCVSYTGGTAGAGGEVCVTSQGILGYVHADASNTTFELSHYSTSVSSSTFQTPAGATITTIPGG